MLHRACIRMNHIVAIFYILLTYAIVAALLPATEDGDERVQRFLSWFTENGGFAENLSLTQTRERGRGVLARRPIREGEMILDIPRNLIITADTIKQNRNDVDPLHLKLSNVLRREDDLILSFLLSERLIKGTSSFWWPYLAVLPDSVENLSLFDDDEISMKLGDRTFEEQVIRSNLEIKERYLAFSEKIRSVWPLGKAFPTLGDFLWGQGCIDSRGLRFRGKVYLAPMADMFNYVPHSEERAPDSGAFFLKYHEVSSEGGLRIYADRSHQEGEEVVEDYGDNDNNIYLQYHGFVPESNPFTCVSITVDAGILSAVIGKDLSPSQSKIAAYFGLDRQPLADVCLRSDGRFISGSHGTERFLLSLGALAMTEMESSACFGVLRERGSPQGNAEKMVKCGFFAVRQHFFSGDAVKYVEDDKGKLEDRALALFRVLLREKSRELRELNDDDGGGLPAGTAGDSEVVVFPGDEGDRFKSRKASLAARHRASKREVLASLCSLYGSDCDAPRDNGSKVNEVDGGAEVVTLIHPESEGPRIIDIEVSLDGSVIDSSIDRADGSEETMSKRETESDVDDDDETFSQRLSTYYHDPTLANRLDAFNLWFNRSITRFGHTEGDTGSRMERMEGSVGPVSKVRAVSHPIYRVSVVATEPISKGSVYLGIPARKTDGGKGLIMDSDGAFLHPVFGKLVKALFSKYKFRDDFHELLLFLLFSYFAEREASPMWPYLALLPTPFELAGVPTLWERESVERRLNTSFVKTQVISYIDRTEKMFQRLLEVEEIATFFKAIEMSGSSVLDLQKYKWASVILDSRSIWWEGKRHLVPMLDFVNCRDRPTQSSTLPYPVHATSLSSSSSSGDQYRKDSASIAQTKSAADFALEEEVFENYGQPNHIYYVYHGFSIDGNLHDCVHFDFVMTTKEKASIDWESLGELIQRYRFRDRSSIAACLPTSIDKVKEEVWVFLSLQSLAVTDASSSDDTEQEMREAKEENKAKSVSKAPTFHSVRLLLHYLQESISSHESAISRNGSSITTEKDRVEDAAVQFLQTEHAVLVALRRSVYDFLSS